MNLARFKKTEIPQSESAVKSHLNLKLDNVLRMMRVEKSFMILLKKFFLTKARRLRSRSARQGPLKFSKNQEVENYFNIINDPIETVVYKPATLRKNAFKLSNSDKTLNLEYAYQRRLI